MTRAERFARNPRRWPLRWRLAAVSAILTMAILVVFAVVIGRLAEDRIRDDFDEELQSAASQIATEIEVATATGELRVDANDLQQMAMADAAVVRILGPDGEVERAVPGNLPLGPPRQQIYATGDLSVATAPVITSAIGAPQRFVQYARDHEELDQTISRLWLFLGAGVLAGAALAALAGFVVASRAMRPISDLTATAREIAATRDPSRRVSVPDTGDEVAELAQTLDEMLLALDASRAEREQMMQAQRDFVADASHELRTPLTSVLANLELLEASLARESGLPRDDEEDSATVDSALRSSRRMSRLVSDLLLLARADAGRAAPRREVDLTELATSVVEEVRPIAGEHEIGLRADGDAAVLGNPDELHRMVLNLVDNAVRHTPDGSRIEVRVDVVGDHARLAVADDGPGLPEGLGDQIFDRFVRGSGPADRSPDGGTGLGLAIVRAVATSHGGEVHAGRSERGGARFEITLPLAESFVPDPTRVS
jgi:two-component system, OmpR family, sensor kinase